MISLVKLCIAIQALFVIAGAESVLSNAEDNNIELAAEEVIEGQNELEAQKEVEGQNENLKVTMPGFTRKVITTFQGTGYAMDAYLGVMGDVRLWGTHGQYNQQWTFTPAAGKSYGEISVILSNGAKGCLSAGQIKTFANVFVKAVTAPCNPALQSQQMHIQPRFSGNFIMVTGPYGIWCLNLSGGILSHGNPIGWYSCYGVPNDTWGIV